MGGWTMQSFAAFEQVSPLLPPPVPLLPPLDLLLQPTANTTALPIQNRPAPANVSRFERIIRRPP
jgi:hypothetical protein